VYTPVFPYLGNQAIVSSGRVVIHSYDDFIFLFGKKGVSISSPSTFTIDANERTIIASPKIELGYKAELDGQPVLLGNSTVAQLGLLLDDIQTLCRALKKSSATQPENAVPLIIAASKTLEATAKTVRDRLSSDCLSKNTYTK